ncbi:MAG: hypothetical protein H0W84_00800 [Bacteroidetes bacterium]|nr:hypothetical protein [Bacteroidota bacterium]
MKTYLKITRTVWICFCIMFFITIISCKEGNGGKSNVSGYVKHHDKKIPNAVVYIKYGATDFPGTNTANYDVSVTADASAHYEFKDLRKGDYYLYSVGYDNSGPYTVTGGVGVKLKYNKTTITDIPVTE